MLDKIYKELEHIRLVHFTVLAVAAASLYLVYAARTEGPALREELLQLRAAYAPMAAGKVPAAIVERVVARDSQRVCEALGRPRCEIQIDAWNSRELRVGPGPFSAGAAPWPDANRASLLELRAAMAEKRWVGTGVGDISVDDEVRAVRKLLEPPPNWFAPPWQIKDISVFWPAAATQSTVRVEMDLWQVVRNAGTGFTGPRAEVIGREHHTVTFDARKVDEGLGESWVRDSFPIATSMLDSVGKLTTAGALERADAIRSTRLEGANVSFLGLTVGGRDLALVGPLSLLAALCYAIVYVRQLRVAARDPALRLLADGEVFVSPWIGVTADRVGQLLFAITLLLPVASALALAVNLAGRAVRSWLLLAAVVGACASLVVQARGLARDLAAATARARAAPPDA
jgi:hypothetical protein